MISSTSGPKAGPEVAIGTFTDKNCTKQEGEPQDVRRGDPWCSAFLRLDPGQDPGGHGAQYREMGCGKENVSDRLCAVEAETDGASGGGGWDTAVASQARAFAVIKQSACAGNPPSESLTGFLSLIFPGL